MAVIEIQAKTILSSTGSSDGIFGMRYNMNLYRGCQHQCIYCDSRSLCYGIENFRDILVKVNALDLLAKELPRKRVKGKIGTGSMNDPYMPVEMKYDLAGRALELIAQNGFGVSILTKSALVLRDVDRLAAFPPGRVSVGFTITTTDDALGRKIEPGASLVSERLQAMRVLAGRGIQVGVSMMPILPFLEDNEENITAIVTQAAEHGASFIVPWFGMSLRDRQREYYYTELDRHFPGVRKQYERMFGLRYEAPARWNDRLAACFYDLCRQYHLANRIPPFEMEPHPKQPTLF